MKKLGVAPIFAMLVERFGIHTPVGVLTGSLVILPKSANPRYLLFRESKLLWLIKRRDYHAIPEELGRKKEYAELFLRKWTESMGPAKLIYTRTPEGRITLVQVRMQAMSAAFVEQAERLSVWR